MIEIGKQKQVALKQRRNGKLVPVFDDHSNPVTKVVASEVWRVTRNTLGGQFGPDGKRKLVVGLCNGDLLVLKPKGTRQKVTVDLKSVYAWCLRSKAVQAQLEKARKRKEQLAHRREESRRRYAEARLLKDM